MHYSAAKGVGFGASLMQAQGHFTAERIEAPAALNAASGLGRGRLCTGGTRPASSPICNIHKNGDMTGGGITVACEQRPVRGCAGQATRSMRVLGPVLPVG